MVRLSLNSTFSATVLNRLAVGYNRFRNQNGAPPETVGQDYASQIGIQNTADSFFPVFRFSGTEWQGGSIARMGVGFFDDSPNGSYALQDDVTWLHGSHSFRIGYDYMRYFYNDKNLSGAGDFTFAARSTDLPGFSNETGHAFASFLLGAVNNGSRGVSTLTSGFRQPYHAFYIMDDWKLTPKLTINVGLRWEVIPAFYEVTDRMSVINLDAPNPDANNLPGALTFPNRVNDTYWKEIGPRFGFAYRAIDKMVIRGGYAITNTPPIRNDWGYGGTFTRGFDGSIPVRSGHQPDRIRGRSGDVPQPAVPEPGFAAARYRSVAGELRQRRNHGAGCQSSRLCPELEPDGAV